MSYSVFVTRKKQPHGSIGAEIALTEWKAIIDSDRQLAWAPELGNNTAVWKVGEKEPEWIDWCDGNLEVNRPSSLFIEKLVSISDLLHARLVGEEGEVYGFGGKVDHPPPHTQTSRLLAFWWGIRAALSPSSAPDPGFSVGTRVRGLRARLGTVTEVNLRAERGLGRITVCYDDGHSECYTAVAHCPEAVGTAGDI